LILKHSHHDVPTFIHARNLTRRARAKLHEQREKLVERREQRAERRQRERNKP
jgi:hypothetical protein